MCFIYVNRSPVNLQYQLQAIKIIDNSALNYYYTYQFYCVFLIISSFVIVFVYRQSPRLANHYKNERQQCQSQLWKCGRFSSSLPSVSGTFGGTGCRITGPDTWTSPTGSSTTCFVRGSWKLCTLRAGKGMKIIWTWLSRKPCRNRTWLTQPGVPNTSIMMKLLVYQLWFLKRKPEWRFKDAISWTCHLLRDFTQNAVTL